jgi:hypothetical protein
MFLAQKKAEQGDRESSARTHPASRFHYVALLIGKGGEMV